VKRHDLKPGLLIEQLGHRTLYKVSTIYEATFTATVVYPVQPRTKVHRFSFDEALAFGAPSKKLLKAYDESYR
jgi:hypothetical protein